MNIKTVIVDKVPDAAFSCPKCKSLSFELNVNDIPVSIVDCSLFGHETVVEPFNHFLERCIFCPLMTEEEYKAKLEAEWN